ncbi:MAG: FtsX-like permease family protein, partial [Burkholderiales bacterium]
LVPLTPGGNENGLLPAGKPFSQESLVNARLGIITLDYFRTLRVPLKHGRVFTADDRRGAPLVMIVNESAARGLFPGEDPIGRQVACCEGSPDDPRFKTIVGVVADVRSRGPAQEARAEFFLPIRQAPDAAWTWTQRSMTVVARSRSGDAAPLIGAAREVVRRIDPTVPLYQVRTMEQRLEAALGQARFNTLLMLLLGGIGLVLAAIGVYGVISYVVAQRQQEIGIRMALGASGPDVVRLVVGQGMQPVALGIALGLAASSAISHTLASSVHGVTTTDPLTFAAVVTLVGGVALAATALPARRAVRVDPTRVLHSM